APRAPLIVTPRRLAPPAERRALSLRVTLLAVTLAAGVYAGALPLHLFFRVSRPALALGDATEAIAAVGLDVARRRSAIHRVLTVARSIARSGTLRADSLRVAHRLLELARAPLRIPSDAAIAPALRTALRRTDDALSRVATALADLVGAVDAGRQPEAARLGRGAGPLRRGRRAARRRGARGEQSPHGDRRARREPPRRSRVRGGATRRDDPDPAPGAPRHQAAPGTAAVRARDRARGNGRQSQRCGAGGARSRVVSLRRGRDHGGWAARRQPAARAGGRHQARAGPCQPAVQRDRRAPRRYPPAPP